MIAGTPIGHAIDTGPKDISFTTKSPSQQDRAKSADEAAIQAECSAEVNERRAAPRRFPPSWTIEDNGVSFQLIRQVVEIRKSTGGYRRGFCLVAWKIDLLIKPSLLSRQQRCDVFRQLSDVSPQLRKLRSVDVHLAAYLQLSIRIGRPSERRLCL